VRVLVALLVVLPFNQWRTEDRVLISDYSYIAALAASPFLLYAATARALLIYDRPAHRWQLPVTTFDGYPRALVRVALADRVDDAVWLGTTDGWARYDSRIRQWTNGPISGGVADLAQDASDPASGIYLRTANGWTFLPRGALLPMGNRSPPANAVRPLDPQTALARSPQVDAMRALILTDPRLRTYTFTSAASTPDQNDLFFGTNGLGIVHFEGFGSRWETLALGLHAPTAFALAPAADGVWVGTNDGLAFLSQDLSESRWIGAGARGIRFREARRVLARAGLLWVVSEQGVSRVDPASGRGDVLLVDEVRALAAAPDGVLVGTTHGLVFLPDTSTVAPERANGVPVLSLLTADNGWWVGTTAGLAFLSRDATPPRVPDRIETTPALQSPIVALGLLGDTVVAATPDQLAWRNPTTKEWTVLRPRADVGRLTVLASSPDGVWVGGDLGVAFWRIGAGTFKAIRVPIDLPARTNDLLVSPPYLWVATDSGVVRLVREAVLQR